jgi:hypothetical protein
MPGVWASADHVRGVMLLQCKQHADRRDFWWLCTRRVAQAAYVQLQAPPTVNRLSHEHLRDLENAELEPPYPRLP